MNAISMKVIVFGVAVMLSQYCMAQADDRSNSQSLSDLVDSVKETTGKNSVVIQLAQRRLAAIGKCLVILETGSVRDKVAAARMLGDLRAKEAIEPLLKIIDLQNPDIWERTTATMYPGYFALVQIGYDSVTEIRQRIGREKSKLRVSLMLHVVKNVLDEEDAQSQMNRILAAHPGNQAIIEESARELGLLGLDNR